MSESRLLVLARGLGYKTGTARRSSLRPDAPQHALVPGGAGPVLLCSGSQAKDQISFGAFADCPRCLAVLRQEADEG